MTNLVSNAVSGATTLWHRPGASGVAVVQSRPETPGAVAIPLAMPRSRGGPRGAAPTASTARSASPESLLDHLGLLGSGYLGVPVRVLPRPAEPGMEGGVMPDPRGPRGPGLGCLGPADHVFPPAAQLAMARHAQAHIVK